MLAVPVLCLKCSKLGNWRDRGDADPFCPACLDSMSPSNPSFEDLSDMDRITDYLRGWTSCTPLDLAFALRLPETRVQRLLMGLVAWGLVDSQRGGFDYSAT